MVAGRMEMRETRESGCWGEEEKSKGEMKERLERKKQEFFEVKSNT